MYTTMDENGPLGGGTGKRLGRAVIVVAGAFALTATLMTVVSIWLQSKNYRKPLLQRYVIRILVMVPIYSAASWTSLVSLKAAFWVDPFRDVYEAFTIYTFFQLLINFIGGERALIILMHGRPPVHHPWPLNYCFAPLDISDPHTFLAVKRGILQYTWIKPLLSVATVIMKATKTYQEGYIGLTSGYLWSGLIYNVSISISLYALAMFWVCMSVDLKPFRPMPKFVSIKGIIFASYWQGFFLSILVWLGAIPDDVPGYTQDNLAASIQDALICFEMPAFAILHWYAFSWHDYADVTISAARMPVKYALRDAFGSVDLIQDAKETFTGSNYEYRLFDATGDVLAHEDSAQRVARTNEGMRYSRGKGKYWIPNPHEATSKTPLLGKLTGTDGLVRSPPQSDQGSPDRYGATLNGSNDEVALDDDDEKLYESARELEFGDWNYPVITAHEATREDRLYSDPNMLTASTNRHVLQPTKDNRARRKSRIEKIQKSVEKGKHRDSESSLGTDVDDDEGTSRGRHHSRIPLIGSIIESVTNQDGNQARSESRKSNSSQLVDLVVEDYDAEEIERVRARKEGSPGWNRYDAKHYVRAYPGSEDEEEVREGFEANRDSRKEPTEHTVDDEGEFAIGDDDDDNGDTAVDGQEGRWKHRDYNDQPTAEEVVEGGKEEDRKHEQEEEEKNGTEKVEGKGKGKGKERERALMYDDVEENVWGSPRR